MSWSPRKSWLLILVLTTCCWAGAYRHCSIKDIATGKAAGKYLKTSGVIAARSSDEYQWWFLVCNNMQKEYCITAHVDKHVPMVVPEIGEIVSITLVRDDE
jgi:hypothetical protein